MENPNVDLALAQIQAPPFASQPQPLNIQHMYKNLLQEFAQRSNIEFPMYETVIDNEVQHAPNFKSTVIVGGVRYASQTTFSQRKAAEQDAARLALESIANKHDQPNLSSLLVEDFSFCKSVLNEYAMKLRQPMPSYNTVEQLGLLPFVSTLTFNAESYIGDSAKNKKSAEQFAARSAIISILGDSELGPDLYDIIRSKCKNFDTTKLKAVKFIYANIVQSSPMENVAIAPIENIVADVTSDEAEGAKGLLYLYGRELELIKIKENANKLASIGN